MSRWWVFLILSIPFQFLWADEVTVEVVDNGCELYGRWRQRLSSIGGCAKLTR